MPKFRKKPVEVEAWFYDGSKASADLIISQADDIIHDPKDSRHPGLFIDTLEGVMTAMPGDWVIKGIKGEFYPCKPDIFMKSYEPIE